METNNPPTEFKRTGKKKTRVAALIAADSRDIRDMGAKIDGKK